MGTVIQVYEGDGHDAFAAMTNRYIVSAIGDWEDRPATWVSEVRGGIQWCENRGAARVFSRAEAEAIAMGCRTTGISSIRYGIEPA